MQKLALFLAGVLAISAVPTRFVSSYQDAAPAITDDLIAHVNTVQSTWTADMNPKFDGMTVGQARMYMGTILGGRLPEPMEIDDSVVAPDSFDARTQWPGCPSIALVRDQSACGSCWAFGSTEAFNDRFCIATNNTAILAAADVLSCCDFSCGDGCQGGYPQNAWAYFKRTGATLDSCFPYPFPACAHHVVSPDYPPCPSGDYDTPMCNKTCADGSDFTKDKVKAKTSYSVSGEANIMKEISTYGPVTAAFSVYNDFLAYKSGVYSHVTGQFLGGHAVEIVGYGVDKGVKYWTVKNSWNPSWGNGGYFNIKRGSNECGIEGEISAGHAV